MKRLNSKKMKLLLKEGIRKAKKLPKVKSPDYFILIFSKDLKNGWHYQVEKMYEGVTVYAFKPPRVQYAKSAEYYLDERK